MRLMTGLLGALVVAASLVLLVMCVVTSPFAWVLFGFQAINVVAGAFAVALSIRGRASALALACMGGTVFVGATLGYMGTNPPVVGGMSLLGWTAAHLVMAFGLAALGGLLVLRADPRGWKRLITGVVLAVPVVGAIGAMSVGRVREPVMDLATGLPPVVQAVGAVALFVVGLVLISVSIHMTICAFSGREPA